MLEYAASISKGHMTRSPEAACADTALLWAHMLHTVDRNTYYVKAKMVLDLFGKRISNSCPCCEYVNGLGMEDVYAGKNCDQYCPLHGFWKGSDSTFTFNFVSSFVDPCECEQLESVYNNWREAVHSGVDTSKYALAVAVAALEGYHYWKAMREMNITW